MNFPSRLHVGLRSSVGIHGPNGCGKSTLLAVISGHVRPVRGAQTYRGSDMTDWSVRRRAKAGILRGFQDPRPFRSLSVDQMARVYGSDTKAFWKIVTLLVPGLAPDRSTATMSVGQLKLVEVALLLSTGARLVLLDEPCAGISPASRDCSKFYPSRRRTSRSWSSSTIKASCRPYAARSSTSARWKGPMNDSECGVAVGRLSGGADPSAMCFELTGPGATFVTGPNGIGKSTLARALAGTCDCEGSIRLDGVELFALR